MHCARTEIESTKKGKLFTDMANGMAQHISFIIFIDINTGEYYLTK